jgi:hypothetical protein
MYRIKKFLTEKQKVLLFKVLIFPNIDYALYLYYNFLTKKIKKKFINIFNYFKILNIKEKFIYKNCLFIKKKISK